MKALLSCLLLFVLYNTFCFGQVARKVRYTLSGYVTEKTTKEQLPGATIGIPKSKVYTTTNSYGFYSVTLDSGAVEIYIFYSGFKTEKVSLLLNGNRSLNIELAAQELEEVEVIAEKDTKISEEVQMSSIDLPVEQIKKIPALLGEKDVLKVIQLLPGVQKGSEGNAGIYVRGGGADQNLILLDEAPVYNANHLFGFFSVFNGDALKSVELIKGGFPARYGGRLSSVIDLQMKEGNKKEFHGEGGIGIIASRITIEGPILKDKASFVISARRTYIDALVGPFLPKTNKGGYYFYDLNAKLNYIINENNRIYLSGYFGKDKFYSVYKDENYESNNNLNWGNATSTLRWNHILNPKIFLNTSFIFTNYQLGIGGVEKSNGSNFELNYSSRIRDYGLKLAFDYYPSTLHTIKFGLNTVVHSFLPKAVVIKSSNQNESINNKPKPLYSSENAFYIEDDWKISDRLRTNVGLRLSSFTSTNKTYVNAEPRISTRYILSNNFSVKASYSMMYQYVHLLTNSGIGLPTDLWVPSTRLVKPQRSQQIALGLAKDFAKIDVTVSIEGYNKWMKNVILYKEGASFANISSNPDNADLSKKESANNLNWQNLVTAGNGLSYGTEFFIQKKVGKFTGWIGYTLSWTWLKFDSLNFGKRFPARYDRRHDISLVGLYKISDRVNITAVWVYGTGNAITLPLATNKVEHHLFDTPVNGDETYPGTVNAYSDRNSLRMAPYHRLDVGVQFTKKRKRYERTWEFSIYNAYNRQNPFFYYTEFDKNQNRLKIMQFSLFPIIPSISWGFKF